MSVGLQSQQKFTSERIQLLPNINVFIYKNAPVMVAFLICKKRAGLPEARPGVIGRVGRLVHR